MSDQALRAAQTALQAGNLPEAERLLRDVLRATPSHPVALQMLGLALAQGGRRAEGYPLIEQSIAASPQNLKFRLNYAVLLTYSDRPGDPRHALDVIRATLPLAPNEPDLWRLLDHAAERAGLTASLIADWRTASQPTLPIDAGGWLQRATALERIGDLDAADQAYQQVLKLDPANVEAARLHAIFLVRLRLVVSRTIPALRRAIELAPPDDPHLLELRACLGMQLADGGDVTQAESLLRGLVATHPTSGRALRALATILQVSARADEAATLFEQAEQIDPDIADPAAGMQRLFNALYASADDPARLLEMHRRFADRYVGMIEPLPPRRPETTRNGRRLRVGYVSGDFRDSSVARFLLPLIEAQARARRVEVHCFHTSELNDRWTARFQAAADGWHRAHDVNDDVLASMVRAQQIDVLIDCAGYTAGTRAFAFAYRPAPLQVSYLGYVTTTGLTSIDARLTDAINDPPGETETFHVERLLRLPTTFAVFQPPDEAPPVAPSPAQFNGGQVTFGTASYAAKLNDAVVDTWAAALAASPPATRLLMINAAYADAGVCEGLRRRFARHGVDHSRIEFIGRLPFGEYLTAHARIDLMLDTFPFNGHTTTVQHLWMGVPVLTLIGQSYRGRMGASVLTNIGLPQLIARDRDDFVRRAADLAHDPSRLADLRATMRARMLASPLMDVDRFAREFDECLIGEFERLLPTPPATPPAPATSPAPPVKPAASARQLIDQALERERTGDARGAADAYQAALRVDPDHAEASRRLAMLCVNLRIQHSQTIPLLRRALELAERQPSAGDVDSLRDTLAWQLAESGAITEGESIARAAIDSGSTSGVVLARHWRTLGAVLDQAGRAGEAANAYATAARTDPSGAIGMLPAQLNVEYLHPDDPGRVLALRQTFEDRFIKPIAPFPPRPITPLNGRRLRVGYVSGDFRDSSVGAFLLPLVEAQRAAGRVEIHCFSNHGQSDAFTQAFRAAAHGWHSILGQNDAVVAQRVRELQIEVLIDLAGYTANTRLFTFARRPAPLQVHYLGHPDTVGLSCIDARITDRVADPPGQTEAFHTERLLRLPHTFGLFRPPTNAPDVAPAPCTFAGHVTFGSVSLIAKVNDAVLDAWAAILRAGPDSSRLLMINAGFADAGVRARFADAFAARGVDRSRLDFMGRLPFADYLKAHARIDLILDTFPFNGHTTTVQSLWMGVPVLTIAGKSHRARMGTSVLQAIDLPDLIASDVDEFVARAATLVRDPQRLIELRMTMRERMRSSPLMDAPRFAADFDALLINEWTRRANAGA